MKNFLKIIGIILWICGGGALIGFIFTGIPIAIILIFLIETMKWIFNFAPQIITVIALFFLLYYGFTKKA